MENGAFKSVWQGLSFYTEEDRTLFYGRDRETEQLCDEIGRSPLCIVYGPSGAGKTSLLRAGVFPRLRAGGWLPVYVRLDHSGNARPYALQVEEAVLAAAGAARLVVEERCPPLSSSRGETLWEWFHRHVFRNAFKKEIRPVVVIDQFEEIFTLARAGETADAWFAELSDLAENSVPAVVVRDMEGGVYGRL